jgi:PAS domain S-box-containing protein
MKETTYYILAGILFIVVAFLRIMQPESLLHFNLFSSLFVISSPLTLGLFCLGVALLVVGFFYRLQHVAVDKNKNKIFDEPQSETISTAYISLKWRCVKVNKLFCQLLGYGARELLKMDFQRLIHPDDFKNDLLSIQKILDGQQTTHQSQQRYLDKNGDLIALSVTISLMRNKEGKPLYFICQFQKPHTLMPLPESSGSVVYSTTA